MNIPVLLLIGASPLILATLIVLPRRLRMERRARALLEQHPEAERTSVYLAFGSGWATGKQRETEAKIGEMQKGGWTFLRATEANPLRTLLSWGGGVNLQFIRAGNIEVARVESNA